MTATRTGPARPDETEAEALRGTASRLVLWAGLTAGTALVVLAEWGGAHPRIGGMPAWLGYVAGFVVAWLVLAGLAVWAAELMRRHHRALTRHAARHGRRAALAAARTAGNGSRAAAGRLAGWAGPRWQRRQNGDDPGGQEQPAAAPAGDLAERPGAPVPDPHLNDAQRQRDANGQWNICAACGNPGTPGDPLVIADGYRVHRSHTTDPADGFHQPAGATAPAVTIKTGGTVTATTAVPGYWHGVASATADFHPDSDAELLDWMSGEVAGMLSYGEAVAELHEHCVTAVRADPAAMAALHDVADAAADAAEAMARAISKFTQVYEGPREFTADGGVLPKSGDWLTGDGGA